MAIDVTGLMFPFSAGALTLLSPCGYALLPGYVSYYLGAKLTSTRAIAGGLASTLGLIILYSVIGLMAATLRGLIYPYLPTFTLIAAYIVIMMGVLMLMEVRFPSLQLVKAPGRRGLLGFFLFGIAYGLAASGCTAPIFLSVLLYALTVAGFFGSTITFLVYALGVGVPLILISLLVARAKESALRRFHRITPWLHKASGTILILVGIYLIYFYYSVYVV